MCIVLGASSRHSRGDRKIGEESFQRTRWPDAECKERRSRCLCTGLSCAPLYTETANVMIWLPIGADRMLGEPVQAGSLAPDLPAGPFSVGSVEHKRSMR